MRDLPPLRAFGWSGIFLGLSPTCSSSGASASVRVMARGAKGLRGSHSLRREYAPCCGGSLSCGVLRRRCSSL